MYIYYIENFSACHQYDFKKQVHGELKTASGNLTANKVNQQHDYNDYYKKNIPERQKIVTPLTFKHKKAPNYG